jgi:hypothetical protein
MESKYFCYNSLLSLPNDLCFLLAFFVLITACQRSTEHGEDVQNKQNTLTDKEKKEGWKLLYDGKTTNGWRGIYSEAFPDKGWKVKEGALTSLESSNASERGGAIITMDQFDNFELSLEFKISKGANSGIKYFVIESLPKTPGHGLGFEYAILDDANFIYPERGRYRTLSSLYDLIPAKNKEVKPLNEWNEARIIVQGNYIEHWLNGNKVVEFERGSEKLDGLIANSKYKDIENFGEAPKGHILLQDEGTATSFRNIKIKILP